MSSTLRRYQSLRSRPVGRSKLANTETCARCPNRASVLRWCRACAEAIADQRVGRFVKERDGACVVCGDRKMTLQWAHIYGRRFRRIRWDPRNSVAACPADHAYLDTHPAEKWAFFRRRFPGLLEELDVLRHTAPVPDLVAILTTYRRAA